MDDFNDNKRKLNNIFVMTKELINCQLKINNFINVEYNQIKELININDSLNENFKYIKSKCYDVDNKDI